MSAPAETESAKGQQSQPNLQDIVSEIGSETSRLLQNTCILFARESQEKVGDLIANLTKLVIALCVTLLGLAFLLVGLNALLIDLVAPKLIQDQTAQWLIPALIGLVTASVGWGFWRLARNRLSRFDPVPEQTVLSIERDKDWIAENTKGES